MARGIQQEADANYTNDALSAANAITLQTIDNHRIGTIEGTLMAFDDEDFFSLGTANAGETIFLSVRTPDGSLDAAGAGNMGFGQRFSLGEDQSIHLGSAL